jgi:hypothetical protein
MTAPTLSRLPNNPHLQRIAADLPDYQHALELAASCDHYLDNMALPPQIPAELNPLTTGTITADWHNAVDEHDTDVKRYHEHRQRTLNVKQRALAQATSIFATHVNYVLGELDTELRSVMAQAARIVRDLDGAHTAEQAIGRGVADAWRQLTDLVPAYASLRAAQEWVLINPAPGRYWQSVRPHLGGEDHASLAYLRNLQDIWPSWRNPHAAVPVNIDGSKPRLEPWPSDSGPELLIWLVTSGAEVWIPTLPQIDELFAELKERREAQLDPQEHAERVTLNEAPRNRKPDYGRVAAPLASSNKPQLAQTGVLQ